MSTPAASGLLAILVCGLLQGNPLQLQVRLEGSRACLLQHGVVTACAALPGALAMVDPRAGRR
jgi:hypothetical protein